MAMAECLDAMPENYERRGEVINLLKKAMDAVIKNQDKTTGVWYDVMDVKSDKNYLESTASSMFAYVLLKGCASSQQDEMSRTYPSRRYTARRGKERYTRSGSDAL